MLLFFLKISVRIISWDNCEQGVVKIPYFLLRLQEQLLRLFLFLVYLIFKFEKFVFSF